MPGRTDLRLDPLNRLLQLAAGGGIVDGGGDALQRRELGAEAAVILLQHLHRPDQALPHRGHVHIEEHAVAFQPEPARTGHAGNDEHVRCVRQRGLHLRAHALRTELHGRLQHLFHCHQLGARLHLPRGFSRGWRLRSRVSARGERQRARHQPCLHTAHGSPPAHLHRRRPQHVTGAATTTRA